MSNRMPPRGKAVVAPVLLALSTGFGATGILALVKLAGGAIQQSSERHRTVSSELEGAEEAEQWLPP